MLSFHVNFIKVFQLDDLSLTVTTLLHILFTKAALLTYNSPAC